MVEALRKLLTDLGDVFRSVPAIMAKQETKKPVAGFMSVINDEDLGDSSLEFVEDVSGRKVKVTRLYTASYFT